MSIPSSTSLILNASETSFRSKLEARVSSTNSLLCIGLDPHEKELFPKSNTYSDEVKADAAFTFCKNLVDSTLPYAACYKPNASFFEAFGPEGMQALVRLCKTVIPPDVPILLDVKRGDIGSTAIAYAQAAYEKIGADAVTLSPLMGWDSVSPFVTGTYSRKGAFLLCKTSNPGSNELLSLKLAGNTRQELLYERIARLVGFDWASKCSNSSSSSDCNDALLGLVVGATDPMALSRARAAAGPAVWILTPGVGAQGGDLTQSLKAGLNANGSGLLISVSRGISQAKDPSAAAKNLCEEIQTARSKARHDEISEQRNFSIESYQEEFIKFSLDHGVLKFGSFALKSGRTSPYFFNAGLFCSGSALSLLGKAYSSLIMSSSELVDESGKVKFDVIFGPAYKGISLAAVIGSALFQEFGVDVGFAYNRKEAKDHGEGGILVGCSMEGKRVLITDDVITAGTAIRESFEFLNATNAHVVGVVTALDRAEIRSTEDRVSASQAVARDLNLPVLSIINLPMLQIYLEKRNDCSTETLEAVDTYRKEFGV